MDIGIKIGGPDATLRNRLELHPLAREATVVVGSKRGLQVWPWKKASTDERLEPVADTDDWLAGSNERREFGGEPG